MTGSLGILTRVDRMWMLAPFKKVLTKRYRETVLLEQLNECIERLFKNPEHPSLNLETLHQTGKYHILSARLNKGCRVIAVKLAKSEIGLLYFDSNHDAAYEWVDRNRANLSRMLARYEEVARGVPVTAYIGATPTIQLDEDSPLALQRAEQFRTMVRSGITRYLTYLDPDQRKLVDLNVRGLLLVKGGAGTGKTAVAIHRVKALADKPILPGTGAEQVLYLCYNKLLARTVSQLLTSLYHGTLPDTIEVKTFHTWCSEFLQTTGRTLPTVNEEECRQAVRKAFGQISPEYRPALARLSWHFVDDEIEQVIKHNGLSNRDAYVKIDRLGRGRGIKRATREAIWEIHQQATALEASQNICRYCDLPLYALEVLEAQQTDQKPQYRAIIIDEAQDCSPVMIELARKLLAENKGSLAVFADPAQGIYESGFQWTQRALRPSGGNVHWLKKPYRTTREIFNLAQSLIDDAADLADDLSHLEAPERHGPRPRLVVAKDTPELYTELIRRISVEVKTRPANQIGILAGRWDTLREVASILRRQNVPATITERGMINLDQPTIKLVTFHSSKGLDFPYVFIIGPHMDDLGGKPRVDSAETRRVFYVGLTRSSECLTIMAIYGKTHPVLEQLVCEDYDAEGSCARSFVNLLGVSQDAAGNITYA